MRRRHHTNSEAGFDFNPLIPNGMRLYQGHEFDKEHIKFQSTHPKRDETSLSLMHESHSLGFQSTHPKRDET